MCLRCDGSGWLKTPELAKKRLEKFRAEFLKTDEQVIKMAEEGFFPPRGKDEDVFRFAKRSYIFEWLYLIGREDLIPEECKKEKDIFR